MMLVCAMLGDNCTACRIKDAGLSALCSSLQGLQALSIAGNVSFSANTLQELHQLSALTSLHTSNNALHNAGLAVVASALPQLLVLDAGGNKISKADALTAMTSLTSLTLSRNPLQISSTKALAGELLLQHNEHIMPVRSWHHASLRLQHPCMCSLGCE